MLFLSTPFDIESVHFLDRLVPAFKISSGDNNFFPLIDAIAQTGKPIILSTGLADLEEITVTRDFINGKWRENSISQDMAMLHCVTNYPVQVKEANLLAIKTLQEKLGVTVGYSDHTLGIEAAVLSVALGARIIEKHFTISKTHSEFRDHQLSADPRDMAELVKRVKEAQLLLGDGEKRPQKSEQASMNAVHRSIMAARDLSRGSIIHWEDLIWLRPGEGLAPGNEEILVGKKLVRSIQAGEYIRPDDVSGV